MKNAQLWLSNFTACPAKWMWFINRERCKDRYIFHNCKIWDRKIRTSSFCHKGTAPPCQFDCSAMFQHARRLYLIGVHCATSALKPMATPIFVLAFNTFLPYLTPDMYRGATFNQPPQPLCLLINLDPSFGGRNGCVWLPRCLPIRCNPRYSSLFMNATSLLLAK